MFSRIQNIGVDADTRLLRQKSGIRRLEHPGTLLEVRLFRIAHISKWRRLSVPIAFTLALLWNLYPSYQELQLRPSVKQVVTMYLRVNSTTSNISLRGKSPGRLWPYTSAKKYWTDLVEIFFQRKKPSWNSFQLPDNIAWNTCDREHKTNLWHQSLQPLTSMKKSRQSGSFRADQRDSHNVFFGQQAKLSPFSSWKLGTTSGPTITSTCDDIDKRVIPSQKSTLSLKESFL